MRKEFKVMLITAISLILWVGYAESFAAGGQNQEKSPVFNESGSMVGTFEPAVNCQTVLNSKGIAVYICDDENSEDE